MKRVFPRYCCDVGILVESKLEEVNQHITLSGADNLLVAFFSLWLVILEVIVIFMRDVLLKKA